MATPVATHRLILVLDLAQPVWAVVWIRDVVVVDFERASRAPQNEVDKIGHGSRLVLLKAGNPLGGDVFEVIVAAKNLSVEAVGAVGDGALADARLFGSRANGQAGCALALTHINCALGKKSSFLL